MTQESDRSVALDSVRALAVVGVVFSHVVLGLVGAGLIQVDSPVMRINEALYLFRLPTLSLIFGALLANSLARRPTGDYLTRRLPVLAWLYFVWFFVQNLVELATNGVRNGDRAWSSLLQLWVPPGQLWFLPFLIVATLILVLLTPWQSPVRAVTSVAATLLVSVILWGIPPNVVGLRGISLIFFATVGAIIGSRRLISYLSRPAWLLSGVLIASIAGFIVVDDLSVLVPGTMASRGTGWGVHFASLVGALLGTSCLLAGGALVCHWIDLRLLLSRVGRHTLEIFVAHILFTAGTRVALLELGMTNAWLHGVMGVLAGVAGPLLLRKYSRCLHLSWLFSLPTRPPLAGRPGEK